MSKVYVVQNVKQVSYRTGQLESKYNHSRAERYGELVYLIDGQVRIYSQSSVQNAITVVKEKLRHIASEDYLLLVGDPVMIGVACGYAMEYLRCRTTTRDYLKLLQWDRRRLDYEVVEIREKPIVTQWEDIWND